MPDSDALQNRGRSLENAFFSNLDSKLLDGLKQKLGEENAVSSIREATGIHDTKVLESLLKLGVTPASLAAMRVFPLIAVAWADGKADTGEITAVRAIASKYIQRGSAADELLETWLSKKPSEEMFSGWETYADAMFGALHSNEGQSLKQTLMAEIHEIAEASGGLLGWGAVSKPEQEALVRIRTALHVE